MVNLSSRWLQKVLRISKTLQVVRKRKGIEELSGQKIRKKRFNKSKTNSKQSAWLLNKNCTKRITTLINATSSATHRLQNGQNQQSLRCRQIAKNLPINVQSVHRRDLPPHLHPFKSFGRKEGLL